MALALKKPIKVDMLGASQATKYIYPSNIDYFFSQTVPDYPANIANIHKSAKNF